MQSGDLVWQIPEPNKRIVHNETHKYVRSMTDSEAMQQQYKKANATLVQGKNMLIQKEILMDIFILQENNLGELPLWSHTVNTKWKSQNG